MSAKITVYKKRKKEMKQEFLNYLRDHDEPEETDINTVSNLIEAVQLINCHKKIIEA